jgi:hypothetical protein
MFVWSNRSVSRKPVELSGPMPIDYLTHLAFLTRMCSLISLWTTFRLMLMVRDQAAWEIDGAFMLSLVLSI